MGLLCESLAKWAYFFSSCFGPALIMLLRPKGASSQLAARTNSSEVAGRLMHWDGWMISTRSALSAR